MEYLGQVIIFISALLAVRGDTYIIQENSRRRLSRSGYLAILCACFGLLISVVNQKHMDENERDKKVENTQLQQNIEQANQRLELIKDERDSLRFVLSQLQDNQTEHQRVLLDSQIQQERREQVVLIRYITINPKNCWICDTPIYTGSIIRLYGFKERLLLRYNNSEENLPPWDGHAIETAIHGPSGQGCRIKLQNTSRYTLKGTIQVTSSPRVRSSYDSSDEEDEMGR